MNAPALSSNEISALIDYILKSKDPATVGLRAILKKDKEKDDVFPLHPATFEEFHIEGKSKERFSEDERTIIDLEKRMNNLRIAIENERKELPAAIQNARDQGYKEGFTQGESAAREKAAKEYNDTISDLQQKIHDFCAQIDNSKKNIFANAHSLLLAFCYEFAKKVLHTEVSVNPDIILPVLQKALSYITDRERLVIRVAKDDWETVSKRKDFWMPVAEKLESIVIEPDERIERGGCIVESNSGVADARLGVRFDELKEVVSKAWESMIPDDPDSCSPSASGAVP
jgi:flagellar assembly protein FliH